jgi:hypothetical protein
MNLKRMAGLLTDDSNTLKAAVTRAQAKYRSVKAKLAHGRTLDKHLAEVEPKAPVRKKGRSHSNPLEYTEQQSKPVEVMLTARHHPKEEAEMTFHEEPLNSELPSVIQLNVSDYSFQGDSVLFDVFNY